MLQKNNNKWIKKDSSKNIKKNIKPKNEVVYSWLYDKSEKIIGIIEITYQKKG